MKRGGSGKNQTANRGGQASGWGSTPAALVRFQAAAPIFGEL